MTSTRLGQIALALALIFGAMIYLESQQRLGDIRGDAERRGDLLFSTLSYQLSDALFLDDVEQIRKDAEFLTTQNTVTEISVFSEDGQYLFDSRQDSVPTGAIDTMLLDQAKLTRESLYRHIENRVEFVGTVWFDDQLLGGFYFEIDLTENLADWQRWLIQTTVLTFILISLASGLAFFLLRTRTTSRSLRTLTSRYQQLIEQSPLPYATYTKEGALTYFNPAQQTLMSARESTQHCINRDYNILEDESLGSQGFLDYFERGVAGETVQTPALEYPDAKDNPLWFQARIFESGSGDEEPEIVVIYDDITAERSAEEEKARLNANMLQSQKLEGLGVMARGIAHDLNNFLTPVLGHADLLASRLSVEDPLKRSADQIMSGARKAADLCSQMLNHAGDTGGLRNLTDMSAEVSDMNDLMRSSVSRKASFRIDLAEDLPPIKVEQNQLRQVILNIIVNASEALGDAVGEVRLVTGVTEIDEAAASEMLPNPNMVPGRYVYFRVEDTGVGMDRVTRENLFNPFYSTKFTGRGLGMSTVISIVGDHEGGIHVDSEPGSGSIFTAYFPAHEETAAQNPGQADHAAAIKDEGQCVLFVEDEEAVRNIGRMMLESLGYSVLTAEDGAVAVQTYLANQSEVDCVVLDFMMPVQDGRETFKQLRALRQDLPVVMATGLAASTELDSLTSEDHFQLIRKPYSLSDLEQAIAEAS